MTIDLHRLRQFVAVAEELHFGRAATRLHMAQPPLSQSVRRLEAALGVTLFERNRRKVELTAAGTVLLGEARRTLQQADDAVRLTRRAGSDELAQLTVTFVSAALYRVLPTALRAFRARYPRTEIKLDERTTDDQIAALNEGGVDLGFVHPPLRDARRLESRLVDRDRLVAAVPSAGPLAARRSLRLTELAREPFILFPYRQGPALYQRIIDACRAAGFLPRVTQEAQRMHTILSLVAAGLGISLVQSSARSMRVGGVELIDLEGLPHDLFWELAVAWRPRGASRATQDFLRLRCLQEVGAHGA